MVSVSAAESGLPQDSIVNLSAIMTVSKERLLEQCGRLPSERMAQVDIALRRSLGLA